MCGTVQIVSSGGGSYMSTRGGGTSAYIKVSIRKHIYNQLHVSTANGCILYILGLYNVNFGGELGMMSVGVYEERAPENAILKDEDSYDAFNAAIKFGNLFSM